MSLSRPPAGPLELTAALSNMSDLQSLIISSSVLRRVEHCLRTCGEIALCRSSRRLRQALPPHSFVVGPLPCHAAEPNFRKFFKSSARRREKGPAE